MYMLNSLVNKTVQGAKYDTHRRQDLSCTGLALYKKKKKAFG